MANDSKRWLGALGATGPEPGSLTVNDAVDDFLEEVERGSARDRYGRRFTPEAERELHWCLDGHVSEEFGAMNLSDVRRSDVEELIYGLADAGVARRRLRVITKSVRALFDYANERGLVDGNPAERIALPDEDDAEQPSGGFPGRADGPRWGGLLSSTPNLASDRTISDRAISLALQVATLAFVLLALVMIAESV